MSSKEIFQNRVAVLPAFGVPNNIYYVPNGNGTDLDEYVADNNGQFRRVRSLSPINVSAGATSADLTAITFSNSNNVSFGLSNGVMTASAAGGGGAITDYISIGQSSLFQLTADNSLSLGTIYTTHTHSQYVNTSQSSVFLTSQTVQPVAASGSNGSFLFSTISFGNLNGFSFYTTNGSIVGSYTDGGGGGGDGYNILAAGTQTANVSTTVVLSNANNVSFGMAGNSVITASASYSNPTDYISTAQSSLFQLTANMTDYLDTSYTTHTHDYVENANSSLFQLTADNSLSLGTGYTTHTHSQYLNTSQSSLFEQSSHTTVFLTNQTVQPVAYSVANGSALFSTLKFVDTNGVSWATSTDGIRATVKTDYQTSGAYLTTAMASNRGSDFVQATAAFAGTNASGTIASDGISVSVNAQSVVPQNVSLYGLGNTTQNSSTVLSVNALSFNAIGSLTVGYSNGSIQLSAPNALTTAMASNRGSDFVQANAVFNGTNASGTIASNAISVSVAAQSAQTGISSVVLSNTTYTSGQISFRDGNGLSWASGTGQGISLTHGLQFTSNTSAITSNAVNTGDARIRAIAASDATYTSGSVTFRDLNGITWQSTTGQQIQITHALQFTSNTSAITSAAVHTSAARIQGIIGSNTTYTSGSVGLRDLNGITWQSTTGQSFQITHDLQYTSNTSAITSNALHTSASRVMNIVAATNSTGGGTASLSSNVSFSNTNNFTFYTSAGGAIVASFLDTNKAGTGVTTAGGAGFSGTLNSAGLSVSIPSWLTTAAQSSQTLAFSLGGNTATTNSSVAANGGFVLAGGNGVTMQQSNNSISISVATNYQSQGAYLTTAAQSTQTNAFSLSGNTATTNSSVVSAGGYAFAGGNGVTLQMSNNTVSWSVATNYQSQGAYLTTADLSQNSSNYFRNWKLTGNTAGTTSSAQGTDLWFQGGNNLTISGSSNSLVFSVGNYLTTARASTDAIGLNTAQSNVTWTANSSGLSLDARGYAGTGTSATNASVTLNSNGLQISVAAPGAAAENNNINLLGANTAGNTTASGSTIGWSGINLTLSGTNNSVVNISAPATSSISGTGQVSISVNASTISIGVPAALTVSRYNEFKESPRVAGEIGQASLHLQPWLIPNLHMDRIVLHKAFSNATNSSNSFTVSDWVGIYTLNVSTLSLLHSASYSTNFSGSGTAGSYLSYGGGIKAVTMGLTQTLTEGMYWIGIIQRTTTGGGAGHTLNQVLNSQINSTYRGIMGAATNATNQMSLGFGVYTVSTSAMPASIGLTQINGNSSVFLRPPSIYFVSGTI